MSETEGGSIYTNLFRTPLMQKPLIILSLVLSLASVGVGYVNRNKLIEAKDAATKLEDAKSASERKYKTLATELAKAKKDLDVANSDLKTANDQLANQGSDSNKISEQISDLQTQKEKALAENDDLKKQIAQKEEALTQAQKVTSSTNSTASLDALTTSNNELQVINDSQKEKIKDLESQVSEFRKRETQRRNKILKQGLEGKILAVNPSWNFVVLSLGDRNGVVSNAEMLIKRDSQLIGRVKITSVEPSTSIADIIASSVKKGVSVQPGDSVIYMGPESDFDTADR